MVGNKLALIFTVTAWQEQEKLALRYLFQIWHLTRAFVQKFKALATNNDSIPCVQLHVKQ